MKIVKRQSPKVVVAGQEGCAVKGRRLASTLNRAIDSMESDEVSRADIIQRMGSAASIGEDTVRSILSGEIVCPPIARLRGFARVLNIGLSAMVSSGRGDGCEYEG